MKDNTLNNVIVFFLMVISFVFGCLAGNDGGIRDMEDEAVKQGYGHINSAREFQWNNKEK